MVVELLVLAGSRLCHRCGNRRKVEYFLRRELSLSWRRCLIPGLVEGERRLLLWYDLQSIQPFGGGFRRCKQQCRNSPVAPGVAGGQSTSSMLPARSTMNARSWLQIETWINPFTKEIPVEPLPGPVYLWPMAASYDQYWSGVWFWTHRQVEG